jgi:hypothetical protein
MFITDKDGTQAQIDLLNLCKRFGVNTEWSNKRILSELEEKMTKAKMIKPTGRYFVRSAWEMPPAKVRKELSKYGIIIEAEYVLT